MTVAQEKLHHWKLASHERIRSKSVALKLRRKGLQNIYSLRGGTAVLDRYDIAGGTAGAGAWTAVTYSPALQTFATGDSTFWDYENIIIAKEGTAAIPQRFYKYSVVDNTFIPFTSDWYFGGAALLGNKIWVKKLSSAALVRWVYCLQSTATNLRRIMIY